MIHIHSGKNSGFAEQIMTAAFVRSVTSGLVDTEGTRDDTRGGIFVFICPDEADVQHIAALCQTRSKILIFGELPGSAAQFCGLSGLWPLSSSWKDAVTSAPAPSYATARSAADIIWSDHPLAALSSIRSRPFLRFDYADEWNNLGYGRITADGGPWSMAQQANAGAANVLAQASDGQGGETPFVTLHDTDSTSILWWNRSAGPVDSAEWIVVEAYLADWRANDLPCVPVVSEIPWGYDGAVTMRLDCDEDIASARPLFELYRERGLPFSLAIKTDQEDRQDHVDLMTEVLQTGGAVLSHSVSHAPRWGGSLEACEAEALGSVRWLEERLPGLTVRHAVSPFHQNPAYVPEGLKRAGLNGFVGGIIANDPEMLLARGGHIPGDDTGCVSHSQQCMMHGECVLSEGDRMAITKQAFLNALGSDTLFGYLDHPFSSRYDYGWGSEEHRLDCHREFLDFIAAQTAGAKLKWLNEDETLDWIGAKARLVVTPVADGFHANLGDPGSLSFGVRYKGQKQSLSDFVND